MVKIDLKDTKIDGLNGLLSPLNQQFLQHAAPHLLTDGEQEFPFLENIAYLRDKPALREQAVRFIKEGKLEEALKVLLQDQDNFCTAAPAKK